MMLMTNSLIEIAAVGGGMIIDAKKIMTNDLIRLAVAASNGSGKIILKNLDGKMSNDLIKIAAAGKGNVIFDLV